MGQLGVREAAAHVGGCRLRGRGVPQLRGRPSVRRSVRPEGGTRLRAWLGPTSTGALMPPQDPLLGTPQGLSAHEQGMLLPRGRTLPGSALSHLQSRCCFSTPTLPSQRSESHTSPMLRVLQQHPMRSHPGRSELVSLGVATIPVPREARAVQDHRAVNQ